MNILRWEGAFRGLVAAAALLWAPGVAAASSGEIAGQDVSQGGFGRSAPVIAALEKYHQDQGQYPAREQDLVPHYLLAGQQYGLYRRIRDGSFALSFGYTRGTLPGLSIWTFRSTEHRWIHSGYY